MTMVFLYGSPPLAYYSVVMKIFLYLNLYVQARWRSSHFLKKPYIFQSYCCSVYIKLPTNVSLSHSFSCLLYLQRRKTYMNNKIDLLLYFTTKYLCSWKCSILACARAISLLHTIHIIRERCILYSILRDTISKHCQDNIFPEEKY